MKLIATILALVSVAFDASHVAAKGATLSHLPNTRQGHRNRLLKSSKGGKGSNKDGRGDGNNGNGTNSDNDDEMRGAMVSCTGPGCTTDAFLFSSTNSGSTMARTTCGEDAVDCEAGAAAQASAVNISPDLSNNGSNSTAGDNNNNNTNIDVSDLVSETFCAGTDCEAEAETTRDVAFVWFECKGFDCYRFNNMQDISGNGMGSDVTQMPVESPNVPTTMSPVMTPNVPTTMSPVMTPTTAAPVVTPTLAPVTAAPVLTPTLAPTTIVPVITPTLVPTTLVPIVTPTIAPTTLVPVVTPTITPTAVTVPTATPSSDTGDALRQRRERVLLSAEKGRKQVRERDGR